MGEKTITTQVKIDGKIVPDFSFDWAVEFQGEKYIMPLRIPAGLKDNKKLKSQIDLTFQHWAIYQLKRWPFVTIQQIAAGTYLPDEEVATVQLNLKDFCILFGQVLEYYYGGAITIDFNDDPVTGWKYKQEATIITISHTKIWNVLIDAFHDKYGVRWEIKAASDNSNTVKGGERYVIRVGYPATEADHIFEYGFEGGLLKVERQVQSEEIRNMLKGRGGETNIPFRYFKNTDPNNPDFRPDPDWVEELANIPFTNLMGATFRSYVQGWKAAHISKYPGYTAVGEANAYAPWAYRRGYTDTKFHPVEFVADEITINPTAGDKQVEILPGYSPYVKKGSSLDKYGPLPDTLDNNDEIYPTLQGTGLDIAVAVEQIESDDVVESVEAEAVSYEYGGGKTTIKMGVEQTAVIQARSAFFSVHAGQSGDVTLVNPTVSAVYLMPSVGPSKRLPMGADKYETVSTVVKAYDANTGQQMPAAVGLPEGSYYVIAEFTVRTKMPGMAGYVKATGAFAGLKVDEADASAGKWTNTFDIWVKDIWGSTKLPSETDDQYSVRVWKPVLGDREGNEAAVMFTSGALVHEDYEFKIIGFPVPDNSKTYVKDGVTHTSHWRITLAKSDAEMEATGLYVPSTKKQGKAGDTFVFINTEMMHEPYVVDAEIRLDNWKKDQLRETEEIKPTFVVTTDRVRLNNEGKPDALINQLRVGNSIRLADNRFIQPMGDRAYETLYLQSITYTYREPTSDDAALNPDVEIVLGTEYTTSANPVSMMQGEISVLQKQVGSISNIEQIVRAVGDKLYLRKDGISDRSLSPTQFFSLLTSGDFRAGIVGGAGWGFYKDENGNWALETDRIKARQDLEVNNLVINQVEGRGGMQVDTAAYMEITRVVETSDGYVCYFDQKDGTVANLFHLDDVAMSMVFNEEWDTDSTLVKTYKRRVVAVDENSVTLSKTETNGSGTPMEGDVIVHYGNYTDATRQYVKVRDVVGGGYERYIEGLDSVNATGVEFYFVGRQSGMYNNRPRWFIGDSNAYIEWKDGVLNIKGRIITTSTLDDTNTTLGTAINSKVEDTDVLWRLHTSQTDAPALPVLGADGTITDFKGWQTDAPAVVSGQFVWTTTYVRYGNGTAKFDGTACVTGRDGKDGKDGVTMTSEVVEYAIGTSGTVAPTSGWSTTIPAVPKGQYQWTRVTTTYSDGTPTVSYSVAYIPKDGEDGAAGSNYTPNMLVGSRDWSGATPKGATNAGTISADKYNGFSVLEATGWWFGRYWIIDVEAGKDYTISCIALGAPDNFNLMLNPSWGSSMFTSTFTQTKSEKRFSTSQWGVAVRQIHCTKSGTLLVDFETADKSLLVKWCAPKVEEGLNDAPVWSPAPSEQLGVTIASESVTYAKNTTGIQPSDASFTATAIGQLGTISGGDYIWSKTEVTYTDGTVLKSYAVSRIGSDGETQIAGLHIAYATGITGSLPHPTAVTGFSTTMVAGVAYKYIGIRKDNSTADSTNFADYDWAEFRGNDGQNGASYSNNMLVGTKDWSGDWVYLSNGTVTTDTYMGCVIFRTSARWGQTGQNIELQPGTYTFSVWVKSAVAGMNLNVYLTEAHCKRVQGTTEWQRVSLTFTLTAAGTYRPRLEKQDAGNDVFYMAGYKLEEGANSAPTWSPHPSEMVATPAKVVIVNAPQLVFTYENNFSTIVGAQQIVLQSTLQGTTGRQWSYRPGSASGFTDYPNATSETFTVPHNHTTYFPNGAKSCTFRCTSGDVYDEVTIYKVSSGSNGVDGANYTENLVLKSDEEVRNTNYEMHRYYLSEDLVVGETYTWTIWGVPAEGKYFRIYPTDWVNRVGDPQPIGDGVRSIVAPWTGGGGNAKQNAFVVLSYPHEPLGESVITKVKVEKGSNPNPVWTPAPADGDGITVILTNESHVFEGDTEKAVAGSTECGVIAYKGATQVAATIGPITGAPAGMSVAIASNGMTSAKFTVAVTSAMAAKQGVLTIPVTVDGKSFTKKFSWSVSLEGQPGADYSENLLADAEFRGMAATEKVARWYKYTNVSVDNTHMMEGRNSMKSAQSGLTAPGWRGISQNYSKDVKPGDVFTCSIWVYCEDTSVFDSANTMNMEMIGSNSSGNRTCTFSSGSIIPSENNKWQQFHVSGTMPAGTVQVQLFAWIRQNGTAWFSSPKLERGSNPSPVWTPNPTDRIPVLSEEYYRSSSDTELKGGSWSANKQPLAANSYYWTRIKKLYGDGTIEYTTPICATGTPGKDALRLDLTNEMAGVACNASGTPVSGALPVKSTAVVYKGGSTDSGWLLSVSADGCTASVDNTTKEISVTALNSTADTATVTVTATKDGYDALTATMSIHKVKPGADGQPATVYQIEPSTNVIKRDMAGTPHPTTLTVTKYITTGAADRQATTEKFLYAWQTDANGINVMEPVVVAGTTAETATIQIAPTAVEVVLELRPVASTAPNVPVLDRETVPVITDVADMEVATRNLLLNSGDWNLPDGAFSSNPLQGDWWWDDLSMSGSNGCLKMTCNATSGNRAAYERLSIRKAALGTTMTLRVKGRVDGRTSGHIYFQLVSNWSTWQTVGQVAADGEFDLIKTFKLSDDWNGDTILAYGFSNANSGISLELEHAGLYIGNVIPTQWTAAPEDGSYLLKAIQRARQDSTEIDGGLILATLLQLGVTDVSGVRKIMSGISGICMKDTDPAIWMGGDMIDREAAADNPDCAKGMFRHNATGYLANGVFRILKDAIEIVDAEKRVTGDLSVVRLDKQGLHLFDSSGRQALLVSSAPVGISTATAARATKIGSTVNATFTYSASSAYKLVASGTSGWNQNIMFSSPVTVADDFASATLTLDMLVTPTGSWSALAGVRPYFEFVVRVMYNDGYEEFTFSQFVDAPGNSKTYTHSFQFSPAKGRKINGVQIINQVASAASGAVSYGTQLRYKATVDVTYGFPDCVRIGGNGMQATLGGARLSCFRPDDGGNGETEMSFTGPNGTFGLKVTSSGFKYRNVNMSSWADWNPGT